MRAFAIGLALSLGCAHGANCAERGAPGQYDAIIAKHAQANGVPETLVRRVIVRESRYNPRARNGPYWGMMQISIPTARGAGFRGSPSALLDADTNLAYGVRYLAGAYRTAGGNHDRAVGYYARGYYYAAKRQGLLAKIGMGRDGKLTAPTIATAAPTAVPDAPPAATFQLASTAAEPPSSTRAVPLPPMRGAPPQPIAATARTIDPKTAGPVLAAAIPTPPIRPVAPQAAGPQLAAAPTPTPRDIVGPRRDGPVTTGSIPTRTATTEPGQPAAPLPPVAPTPSKQPRIIAAETTPALAGAGPLPPSKPFTPLPAPRPAQAAPELAYTGAARPATEGAAGQLRAPNLPLPPRR